MEYQKNKNIQITFTIKESLYSEFKALCKEEKNMPAAVLKEFLKVVGPESFIKQIKSRLEMQRSCGQ